MIAGHQSYEEQRRSFRWHIPEHFNAATDSIDRQCRPGADPDRTALIVPNDGSSASHFSYGELKRLSDLLASAFVSMLVEPGTVVATLLPAGLESCLTTLGCLKAGGIISHIDLNLPTAVQIKSAQTIEHF